MHPIRANYTVSISELRKNPGQLIRDMESSAVAILNRNNTAAYLVNPYFYEHLIDLLEDLELSELAAARLANKDQPIAVNIDDL